MGITISHAIGIRSGRIEQVLTRTQAIAEQMKEQAKVIGMSIGIRRESPQCLLIDIDGCETLGFDFSTFEKHQEEKEASGYSYQVSVLEQYFSHEVLNTKDNPHLQSWPEQRLVWSSDFCKTQFAKSIVAHRFVAELIRSVASVADYAHVHDEGDYYHTLEIEDAKKSIAQLGAMMGNLMGTLTQAGFTVVKGGDTTIKPIKKD